MNQYLQSIIFVSIVGLNPIIFAMDEAFHCKVPLSQSNAQPAPQHEQPKAQAELDAIQFAKEQESKKLSAAANKQVQKLQRKKIENGIKITLKDTSIKGKPFNTDLVEALPADVQKEILKFAYSTAFSDGYQLLPALIPFCPRDVCCFSFQGFDRANKKYKKKIIVDIDITFIHPDPWKRRLQRLLPTGYRMHIRTSDSEIDSESILNQQNGFYQHWFNTYQPMAYENFECILANDNLYLPPSSMRETLESCSIEQLNLIRKLWVKYDERCRGAFMGNKSLMELSAQDSKIFESLPQQMRFNLESNYRIETTKTSYVRGALIGLGCAAAINAAWQFSKQ